MDIFFVDIRTVTVDYDCYGILKKGIVFSVHSVIYNFTSIYPKLLEYFYIYCVRF